MLNLTKILSVANDKKSYETKTKKEANTAYPTKENKTKTNIHFCHLQDVTGVNITIHTITVYGN